MRISVIIPAYNQGQYLVSCIESILSQTLKSHEIIVVNDGSQDDTRNIAKHYPIKYIEQTNRGLSSARNTGLMNMDGDWFYPLDADDMMLENCLEKVTEVIEKNPDVDIIAPSFKTFGTSNEKVLLMPSPTLEDFKSANRIGYFSAIKKKALLEVGGYSSRMTWGYEDLHLWVNLLTKGKKLITIPDILILYRTKEKSMIHDAQQHHQELMAQIYKDFPQIFK